MLELSGLTKRYGARTAVDDVSLQVRPGAILGFVGPNGAGKTTTMRIALGVLEPDAGAVRWQGRPVTPGMRRRFGYMPEERGLYPKMRVGDQLAYLATLHGFTDPEARRAAGHWAAELGIADRIGDRLEALSLGNQQRVQLASALVHGPDVLVLDEPFSGLDPVGVDVMAAVLQRRVEDGAAVIFSSHQLELVQRLCDEVAIISEGRLVAAGTVSELRRRGAPGSRFLVRTPGVGWLAAVPGATVVSRDRDDGLVIAVPDGTDGQAVLDAARAAGPVHAFTPVEPTLADIFRDVVQEPPAREEGDAA